MPDEVDAEELDDLASLAAALTGDPRSAARLLGETLATADRRPQPLDRPALRSLLVGCYLRQRPPAAAPPGDDLPGELAAVAVRLGGLGPFERSALVLCRRHGLPLAETAAILDTSSTTVRRRLTEAEDRLATDPLTVRATLERLSWRIPDAAAVAAARFQAGRDAARRRGRARVVALALGLVLLVALVVPTVRMLQPLPFRTAGDWVLGLELVPSPGWAVELHAVTPDQEFLHLVGESGTCRAVASLSAETPADQVRPPASAERAWVGGRPVRYSAGGLRWTYGKAGEVTLSCTGQDRTALLTLAEGIRFSAGRPFRLPFALDRLPTGLHLVGAGYEDEMPVLALSRQRSNGFVVISLDDSEPLGRRVRFDGVDYRLQAAAFSQRLCRSVQSMAVCIEARTEDTAAPQATFRDLRLATDLRDPSSWFDARDALPG